MHRAVFRIHYRQGRSIPRPDETQGWRFYACSPGYSAWRFQAIDEECFNHLTETECPNCAKLVDSLNYNCERNCWGGKTHSELYLMTLHPDGRLKAVTAVVYVHDDNSLTQLGSLSYPEGISETEFRTFRMNHFQLKGCTLI